MLLLLERWKRRVGLSPLIVLVRPTFLFSIPRKVNNFKYFDALEAAIYSLLKTVTSVGLALPSTSVPETKESLFQAWLTRKKKQSIGQCLYWARKNKESHVASQQANVYTGREFTREGGEIEKIPYLYLLAFGFTILTHRTRASSFAIEGIEAKYINPGPVY